MTHDPRDLDRRVLVVGLLGVLTTMGVVIVRTIRETAQAKAEADAIHGRLDDELRRMADAGVNPHGPIGPGDFDPRKGACNCRPGDPLCSCP